MREFINSIAIAIAAILFFAWVVGNWFLIFATIFFDKPWYFIGAGLVGMFIAMTIYFNVMRTS